MDIRNWPMDKIMQLPDCCFGRRWPIFFSGRQNTATTVYFISELALPDRCVLWELNLFLDYVFNIGIWQTLSCSFKLGDQLPAAAAEFAELEELFPSCDERVGGNGFVRHRQSLCRIRLPVMAQGRRVVVDVTTANDNAAQFSIGMVFSSIPTEVPDWLISGQARSL